MSFWNYIGEFLLFRWLFGKFKESTTEHDAYTEGIGTPTSKNNGSLNGNHDEGIAPEDAVTDVGDNLLDDSDNFEGLENLDDLDIFMRDNNGNNRSCLHHGDYGNNHSSRYSDHQDWNSGVYSQSFDDFHDEQDNYDMMDDDF